MRIGALSVDPPLFLAPMAGVTDRDFRLIVRRIGGVGVVGMEFLSARGLAEQDPRWLRLLHFTEEERPISIQIYGSDADAMEEAAGIVEALRPDLCDVNMGCPANKILKNCAGAALMGDLELVDEILRRVRRRLTIPLTVKCRLGLGNGRESFLELGRLCEARGVDAVTLHGRTAAQKFRGEARWDAIRRLKDAVDIPVIGNGDVTTPDDAVRMLRETGCDGVMIARGATRNPWIFAQTAARLSGGRIREPSLGDRRTLIEDHFRRVVEREEPVFALHKLRTFTRVYSQGLPDGARLRRRIQELETPEDYFRAVDGHFASIGRDEAA